MSKPNFIRSTRLVNFTGNGSLSQSLPSSNYGGMDTHPNGLSSSLVEPVNDDRDLMVSESSGSQTSLNIRRKAAPHLNESSRKPGFIDDNFEDTYHIIPIGDTNKRQDHLTSDYQTLIHVLKGNVGSGLLALPLAVKNAGAVVGGIALLLLGIIATHCMVMLVNVAHVLTRRHPQYQTLNYAQAAEVAVSELTPKPRVVKATGAIVNVFLMITQFGFCCVYFVFIAQNLNQVFCSAFGINLAASDLNVTRMWIALITVPIVVFCWIRNLESLSSFSMIANITTLISLSIIFYEEIYSISTKTAEILHPRMVGNATEPGSGIDLVPSNVVGLALFFGNAIYSFEGIGMVLPLENKMRNPNHFKRVIYLGMGVVIFVYIFVGITGYAVYGDRIEASITLNLKPSNDRIGASVAFLIAKLFYSYAIFASFMLQFYVPMDFLEPSIIKGIGWFKEKFLLVMLYRYPAHHRKIDTAVQLLFRTLIVLFIAGIAMALPDLNDLVALIGAVASSALALIFPPILHIIVSGDRDLLLWKEQSGAAIKQALWMTKDILIILLGVAGLVLGTYASIYGLVQYFQQSSDISDPCVVLFPHVISDPL